jgi:hypothetical protein
VSLVGRRRPDTPRGDLPQDIRPGDFWKVLVRDGSRPRIEHHYGKLTEECWYVAAPMSYGFALGNLERHTVREHEDGTISVAPGDGSSNSILITGHHGEQYHGFIDQGVWT